MNYYSQFVSCRHCSTIIMRFMVTFSPLQNALEHNGHCRDGTVHEIRIEQRVKGRRGSDAAFSVPNSRTEAFLVPDTCRSAPIKCWGKDAIVFRNFTIETC